MTRWRLVGPVLLATICLVALCMFTAISLFHQQRTVAIVLRGDVESRRVAVELEECLTDLLALEKDRVEMVSALHRRVEEHLGSLEAIADEQEESRQVGRLRGAFDEYLVNWRAIPPKSDPRHDEAFREARRLLEEHVLPNCRNLEQQSGRRLERATEEHERVLRQLGLGMAGVAGLGGVAGLVLGFGIALALSRSIRRLRVQVADAAGKIGPSTPEIVLTGQGDFHGLQEEIDLLTRRIEGVVSELQQREREILRAEQLAAVGQLAAGVGHEIRNPLTSIKLLVQSAIEDPQRAALNETDLRMIEQEILRIEQSLQTYLDFARPPKGERSPIDLVEVLHGVMGLVRGRADKQRVAITYDGPPDPLLISADRGQVRQVFVNLTLNALDAMNAGGSLTFRLRRQRSQVEVEVADTGPGIAPAILPRLFTPFVSGKDTGLGLGLVISRRMVEDHGGTIRAGNRAGGGASFVVQLPAGKN